MKETLRFIIQSILADDTNFTIKEEQEGKFINFIIDIQDEKKARLIGKNGKTISAIYHILNIQAKRQDIKIHLKIKD